eukprot:6076698-Lingulodinium_polyedra.AAC.1
MGLNWGAARRRARWGEGLSQGRLHAAGSCLFVGRGGLAWEATLGDDKGLQPATSRSSSGSLAPFRRCLISSTTVPAPDGNPGDLPSTTRRVSKGRVEDPMKG